MASFTWPYDANTVHVTGSFNQWTERIPLTKDAKGVFHTTIPLEPGEHEYKFIVDERRWCYDILKPTRTNNGNRNNVILVGRGQSAPPKGKEQQHAKEEAPKKEHQGKEHQGKEQHHAKEEAPKKEHHGKEHQGKEQPAEQKGGKKEKQSQQQQQQKKGGDQKPEGGEKKGKVSAAARTNAQKVISTVKSYNAPWFVADVDIEDNLDDVIATANIFGQALPESACMFLSGGQKTFIIVALVPPSKVAEGATAIELITKALSVVANPPDPEGNENLAHAIIQADPDKGVFPLKLKDLTRGPVFAFLKKQGLVKDEEDDDDDLPAWDF